MKTSTAIGAGRAIMRITVPEMRQRLYPIRGGMNEYVKSKSFGTDLRAERLFETGDKNIHFLDGTTLFGADPSECTVDGCHATDLGFYQIAKHMAPVIENILTK